MAIEYLGLSSINGPLIALEGVQDAFYDEIVDFVVNGKEHKMGRIVEVYKDKAIMQHLPVTLYRKQKRPHLSNGFSSLYRNR